MSPRLSHILIALSGILGTTLLGLYFGIGFSIGLFTTSLLTIIVVSLQALWVLAAALTFLIHPGTAFDATGEARLTS